MTLPYRLDRIITIDAPREIVFSFFTDSDRWAEWWGAGSTIDARPGGRVFVRHPGNVEASGEVLSVRPPEEIVFSYGYASGQPIGPGASRVTIALEAIDSSTRLHLTHEFAEEPARDEHVQGWRYQLALFSNAVANVLQADAATRVDGWLSLWSESDVSRRAATLAAIAAPSVLFRDRFSHTEGADDLSAHITAAQRFMPGLRLERRGDVRHCQGTVIADWTAVGPDGAQRATGSNVFVFGPDARIAAVTGFWN